MKLLNELSAYEIKNEEDQYLIHEGLSILLRLLAPITPHIGHHLWIELGFEKNIIDSGWPKVDKSALKADEVNFIVQINGKIRDKFEVPIDISEGEAKLLTFSREKVKNILGSRQPKKVIFVPNRLINLVV